MDKNSNPRRLSEDGVLISSIQVTNEKLTRSLDSSQQDIEASKMIRIDQHDVSIHTKPHLSSSHDDPSGNQELKEFDGKKHVNAYGSNVMQMNRSEKRSRSDWDHHSDDVSQLDHGNKKFNVVIKENLESSGIDIPSHKDREVHEKPEEREVRRHDEAHNDLSNFFKGVQEDGESERKVAENDKEKGILETTAVSEGPEREKDQDVGKREKNYTDQEKESEEKVSSDKEDAFGHGIHQKRRMLRPRGILSANRQPKDAQGTRGKDGAFAIIYNVGEGIQELLNSWKEFEASLNGKKAEEFEKCPTLEIRIPPEHVTKSNRQVRGAQLWGTDIYTNDSDLVAVLMHTGYCKQVSSLPSYIQELRATIRVLPPQQRYYSTLRNSVHSRPWASGADCSFRIEKCCLVKKSGGGSTYLEPQLALISFVEPTLVPLSLERTMNTRAYALNLLRQQRFVQEVAVQYNLCNEPWIKYSVNAVSDKGLKKNLYTSARLKKGEVLYLETHAHRYELCYCGGKAAENGNPSGGTSSGDHGNNGLDQITDLFRWSLCKQPLSQKRMLSLGVPLPVEYVEVVADDLEWEDVQWSKPGVWVGGKMYPITRIHFLSPKSP